MSRSLTGVLKKPIIPGMAETETKSDYPLFVTCTRFLEETLAEEIAALGARDTRQTLAGVGCRGDLETAYRICLWSRVAGRVLLQIARFPAAAMEDIYEGTGKVDWNRHMDADTSFAVQAKLAGSELRNENFAALKVKDGIVDFFRKKTGRRPNVETEDPDILINLHVKNGEASLYVDLSGESLSRRGYRLEATEAPLRENSAAAMLRKAGWEKIAKEGGFFLDPMCGSGTLVIEAALIAADIAPGLLRKRFGFCRWKGHDPDIWRSLKEEAEKRRTAGLEKLPVLLASDRDGKAVEICRKNLERAGLSGLVRLEKGDFRKLQWPEVDRRKSGLIAVNPPYGVRLEDKKALPELYRDMGRWAKESFPGSSMAVLVPDKETARYIGLRARRLYSFYNGNLKILLGLFDFMENNVFSEYVPGKIKIRVSDDETSGVNMILHRIEKNRKRLRKYLKNSGTSCYRIYDADIPQYAAAVDVYEERDLVIQEYAPPKTVDPKRAAYRLEELIEAFATAFSLDRDHIHLKQRKKQKGSGQYQKAENAGDRHIVSEGGLKFFVHFTDYLDTGLFLDHRLTRGMIRDLSGGIDVLNLFAYTCTASVYAAAGGARRTVSVDTSAPYLEWGRKNLELNRFNPGANKLLRQDCLEFLRTDKNSYGLIFIDPPTFSNRKGAPEVFDVQRDHVKMIDLAAQRLTPGGIIIFSNNYRRFLLDPSLKDRYRVEDISGESIPPDFEGNPKIHRTWKITTRRE